MSPHSTSPGLTGADGRSFDARIAELDEGDTPAGWVVVLHDISERCRAEAEHAARVAAEASDRAKQRFLAILSHELRTPLTPVLAGAEALIGDPTTPMHQRPTLAMIRRNAELEARLIDDLLDLTRVRHGRLHLRPEIIDAHVPIRHALKVCDRGPPREGAGPGSRSRGGGPATSRSTRRGSSRSPGTSLRTR